jgi:hypothetical protein
MRCFLELKASLTQKATFLVLRTGDCTVIILSPSRGSANVTVSKRDGLLRRDTEHSGRSLA